MTNLTVSKFSSETSDRVISKTGHVNIIRENVGRFRKRFFSDVFTTLVDAQWRYMFCAFILNYLTSWTFFASLWYLMAVLNGDIEYYKEWLAADDKELFEKENEHSPCVRNLYNFASAFLYSIETQNAVGYGFRVVTEDCAGPFILIFQILVSMLIQALTIGVIIAKLARPKKRAQNIVFSRNAVICQRDGVPYLMFRIADSQKSYIVNSHVIARVIRKKMTTEGELVEFYQENLKLQNDNCDSKIIMLWPMLIVHKIDENSPFYKMSAQMMQREIFEIVVLLEGGVESTGLQTQARTSYLPNEILWGHRFQSLVSQKNGSDSKVNYDLFDSTYQIDMPLCSAKDLNEQFSENHQSTDDSREIKNMTLRNLHNGDSNFIK